MDAHDARTLHDADDTRRPRRLHALVDRQPQRGADEAGARLAGKQAMISALLRLQAESEMPDQMPKEMKAFAIAEGKEQGFSLAALFQTHPSIEQRVAALQQLDCP